MNEFRALFPALLGMAVSMILTIVLALQPTIWAVIPYAAMWVFLFDLRGRWNDYEFLQGWWNGQGNQPLYVRGVTLFRLYGQSWCGRTLVIWTAPDDLRVNVKWYYRNLGYRWYHVLPDNFLRVMFKPAFWRNLTQGHKI